MRLLPDARLGPYKILRLLGSGGMGEVYSATDTRLGRTVAIKVLPEDLSKSPQSRRRFALEARAISALNHPHICALYDIGHEGGVDFLILEFLEGETLARRLQRNPLPLYQVLRYAIEIADGLDAAHRQGIVHQDLKPGNIMLTKAGLKLLDFGIARITTPPTSTNQDVESTQTLTVEGTVVGRLTNVPIFLRSASFSTK